MTHQQIFTLATLSDVYNYAYWGILLAPLNHIWQDRIAKGALLPQPFPYTNVVLHAVGPKNFFLLLFWDHILWKVPVIYGFLAFMHWRKGMCCSSCRLLPQNTRFTRLTLVGKTLVESWKLSLEGNPSIQRTSYRIWPIAQVGCPSSALSFLLSIRLPSTSLAPSLAASAVTVRYNA
jgi:hypothetical protein